MGNSIIYANFLLRLISAILDFIITSFLSAVGIVFIASVKMPFGDNQRVITIVVFIALFHWLYSSLFEFSRFRGTPGKILMSIVVVNTLGNRISFTQASMRYLGKLISVFTIFIGFFYAIYDKRNQTIHDKISHTFVTPKTVSIQDQLS